MKKKTNDLLNRYFCRMERTKFTKNYGLKLKHLYILDKKSWYPGEMSHCKYADQFLEIVAHEFIHEALWNNKYGDIKMIAKLLEEAKYLRQKRLNKIYKIPKIKYTKYIKQKFRNVHNEIHGGNIARALEALK